VNEPIFHGLEREGRLAENAIAAAGAHLGQWFHLDHEPHDPSPSAADAAATPTSTTNQEESMSSISDTLHALAARLEKFDDDALNKLEAIQASPVTAEAFDAIAALSGVNPSPVLTAVVGTLKALSAPQNAAAPVPVATTA
jgi:hypothetical protein